MSWWKCETIKNKNLSVTYENQTYDRINNVNLLKTYYPWYIWYTEHFSQPETERWIWKTHFWHMPGNHYF